MTHAVVVGSGLAATFCALALVERRVRVTVLDVGDTLESSRRKVVETIQERPSNLWASQLADLLAQRDIGAWSTGIPLKLSFGSSYPYGFGADHSPVSGEEEFIPPSFALGGYSNVWGATVLPYHETDLEGWPIRSADLEPYYRKVLEHIPLMGAQDSLAQAFPLHKPRDCVYAAPLGEQMASVVKDLKRGEIELRAAGMFAGAARLAVYPNQEGTSGCQSCGLCLHGCPADAIYSSRHTLNQLITSGRIEYRSNCVVRRLEERDGNVRVEIFDRKSAESSRSVFDAAFIGAGALSTGRIMLESLSSLSSLSIMESQKFLIPMLRFKGSLGALDDHGLRLPGAFIEVRGRVPDERWAHLQISPLNDMVLRRLGLRMEKMAPGWRRFWSRFLGRLIFAWGGLHSADSPEFRIRLDRIPGGGPSVLRIEAGCTKSDSDALRRLKRRLWEQVSVLRMFPLTPLTVTTNLGGGHFGGSFPMRQSPQHVNEADILGRPAGLSRTHLIDSSVFPSIPATTIGLTVMANAYRIGANADLNDT